MKLSKNTGQAAGGLFADFAKSHRNIYHLQTRAENGTVSILRWAEKSLVLVPYLASPMTNGLLPYRLIENIFHYFNAAAPSRLSAAEQVLVMKDFFISHLIMQCFHYYQILLGRLQMIFQISVTFLICDRIF